MNEPRPFRYSRVTDKYRIQVESAYEMTPEEWNQKIDNYINELKQLDREPSGTETIAFD